MKCEYCSGKGEIINDAMRWTSCPACGGKGFIDMTNEEWFDTLSTEEKAKKFVTLCKNAFEAENYRTKRWKDYQNVDYWKMWLKQPHTTIKE